METYKYLLDLAIILLCTKALGLATRKVQMPQVVGALLAGVLLGPAMLGILTETSFIHNVAEIGVIVLMFCAGLETDIQELKASGKASFVIALIGVIVPLIGGYATAMFFNRPGVITSDAHGGCNSVSMDFAEAFHLNPTRKGRECIRHQIKILWDKADTQ